MKTTSTFRLGAPRERGWFGSESARRFLGGWFGVATALGFLAAAMPARASDPIGVYALLDKVKFEPNEERPERVQLWGAFVLAQGFGYTYGKPQEGYMYFRVNPEKPEVSRIEWKDLKKLAGSNKAVGFGSRYGEKGRVRKADERPGQPEVYPIGFGLQKMRDSDYEPVRDLMRLKGVSKNPRVDSGAAGERRDTGGRFIVCDGTHVARGSDAVDKQAKVKLGSDEYVLSGGPELTDSILVDDDLVVSVGGKDVFVDDDHCRSDETRPGYHRTYDGTPLILKIRPGQKLRIRAIDIGASDAVLGPLYFHRADGAIRHLTERIDQASKAKLPDTFLDEEFEIGSGFKTSR